MSQVPAYAREAMYGVTYIFITYFPQKVPYLMETYRSGPTAYEPLQLELEATQCFTWQLLSSALTEGRRVSRRPTTKTTLLLLSFDLFSLMSTSKERKQNYDD